MTAPPPEMFKMTVDPLKVSVYGFADGRLDNNT